MGSSCATAWMPSRSRGASPRTSRKPDWPEEQQQAFSHIAEAERFPAAVDDEGATSTASSAPADIASPTGSSPTT